MFALALTVAPPASAAFDRAAYLRCLASDAMSVGGVPVDTSSAEKIGAEAYDTVGGSSPTSSAAQTEVSALAKEHSLSESVASLMVQCALNPRT